MPKLFVHGGFPKAASSTIQGAIGLNRRALFDNNVVFLGRNLVPSHENIHPGMPLWEFERAVQGTLGYSLKDRIRGIMHGFSEDQSVIVSAENLSLKNKPVLFAGLDEEFPITLIFYIRHQAATIPSAWRQWGLKNGAPLQNFIDQFLKSDHYRIGPRLDLWASTLPKARIVVRPLVAELLTDGDPVADFFNIIGFDTDNLTAKVPPANASIDYGLLQFLYDHSDKLFDGRHDTRLDRALARALPDKYKRTNIQMLSDETIRQVVDVFRADNEYVLITYCGLENSDPFDGPVLTSTESNGVSFQTIERDAVADRTRQIGEEVFGVSTPDALLQKLITMRDAMKARHPKR